MWDTNSKGGLLTQSLSRNNTEPDYRVYYGDVPRIPGFVRRLVGPFHFDQDVAYTQPCKKGKSSDLASLWDTDFNDGLWLSQSAETIPATMAASVAAMLRALSAL